jgi:hypothetical protein
MDAAPAQVKTDDNGSVLALPHKNCTETVSIAYY